MPAPSAVPITTLSVEAWPDPVIDLVGHDVRSAYVERFWLGILGPSATWLLRNLVGRLDDEPDGFQLDLAATATELGLGGRSGKHSPFIRSIERCGRFGATHLVGDRVLRVRRRLPPLTRIQISRLPVALQEAHTAWMEGPTTPLPVEEQRERARGLALSLLDLGEDSQATERQLHRWRLHPAIAHDAVTWAIERRRVSRTIPLDDLPPEAA